MNNINPKDVTVTGPDMVTGINPKPDPYADLGEVYASEVSRSRLPRVQPTSKTPTDDDAMDPASQAWLQNVLPEDQQGFHIDGDKRYWER